ncbi:YraN family protein [Clostridium sp. MSJ-4]|uniref:UPF0102 protein KQI89_03575 n=1 Tax=Clostridium simiarum TaxID=2841506 RepID=A0ABS6EX86_9CLOT|nr:MULTISPECIES: YraN family protein [Clostridium]MBU5590833.1 YraN family protein [Clostridium simiarum]
MKSFKKSLGYHGESLALDYIIQKGYELIETNFSCGIGEIDIIAKDGDYVCFIEVKSRYGDNVCTALESITYRKMHKIYLTAEFYIQKKKLYKDTFRFDVIEVLFNHNNLHKITLIKDAFRL